METEAFRVCSHDRLEGRKAEAYPRFVSLSKFGWILKQRMNKECLVCADCFEPAKAEYHYESFASTISAD